jgi:hypothetical protein
MQNRIGASFRAMRVVSLFNLGLESSGRTESGAAGESQCGKDEGSQHDRSPLEAQREWRHEAENNVLDLLEQNGLLAPAGPVDNVLNTIVNNLLFLKQLQAQSKQLKDLIEPQLGNRVYFTSQLIQAAPELRPDDRVQIAVLSMGSRIKVDAWSASVSIMKSKPVQLFSARGKMPFEITPLAPYLTRYAERHEPNRATPAPPASK